MAATRCDVVIFPLPAQGHLNPFNWLAEFFVSSGLSVTFVHSARSFSLLSAKNRSSNTAPLPFSNPRIEVVPDVLPADGITNISRAALIASFPSMEKGFDEVLEKLTKECGDPPKCIITDTFLPWTQAVADKHGIPRIELWTSSLTSYAMVMHMTELAEKGYLPLQPGSETKIVDFIPGLPPFRLGTFPRGIASCDVTSADFQYFSSFFEHNRKVNRVLLNTFDELDVVLIDALRGRRIPVDPIGPLISSDQTSISTKRLSPGSLLPEDATCLDWLDAQQKSSVLYVSFGSFANLDDDSVQELAHGLELSQQSFIWVIRTDSVKGSLDEFLPEGFQSRTQGRGRIISWAPQLAVLAHPAVGAFLSHCGWNSMIESLYMGVPIIGFPIQSEQNTNLQSIIDWRFGMAVSDDQGQSGGQCNRGEVETVIRAMMRGKEGIEARRRATELREAARKATHGSSKANLERLVEDIKCGKLTAPNVPTSE